MNVPYQLWDVFTHTPFHGNPLALIPDASGLSDRQMQAIAKEFNLSETSFVLPSEKADFRARYFTPSRELPMAGHPTIGTVFALYRQGKVKGEDVKLELTAGIFSIKLEIEAGKLERVWMDQGIPKKLSEVTDRSAVSRALGLNESDLLDLPLDVVSAGNPFLMVSVKSLDALALARLNPMQLGQIEETRLVGAFIFTPNVFTPNANNANAKDANAKDAKVQCRMLAEEGGSIAEDPATGSAHGPLGWYMAIHGMLEFTDGTTQFLSHQGIEMNRSSELQVRVTKTGDDFSVAVGGHAVLVGEGTLFL
jgi:trans-2,3-dihydro-3-hydroxyanthranilate isomerase